MCVHIGVGFGVACSDTKAIPEPRNAEQQQCSPAFFVCLKARIIPLLHVRNKPYKLITKFDYVTKRLRRGGR